MRKILIVLFLTIAMGAWADEVKFQTAMTQACFGDHCTLSNTSSINDLSFAGAAMNSPATTVGGNLDLVLGTFTLTNAKSVDFWGTPFKAEVAFTLPPDVNGGDLTYKATILGSVDRRDDGWAWINFGNSVQHFTFANGSFDFSVNDVYLDVSHWDGNDSAQWVGEVSKASQVPEPASLALVGFGLIGVAKLRKRAS